MTASNKHRVWTWKVEATFNPCLTWDELLSTGAPGKIEMPASIEAEIRDYANALRNK
jgi:hypothetical protein